MFEQNSLPFAPVTNPEDLFDNPHLLATGGLAAMILPDSRATHAPLMIVTLGGKRLSPCLNPQRLAEHTNTLLAEMY